MAECTIYDKLRYISETKDLIKAAIESQDVEVLESDTFRKYAEYITEIRKVSSVNGMQGDVVLTIGDLGGYTKEEIDNLLRDVDVDLSDYYTKEEIDGKGYLTEVPVATTETDGLMSARDKEFLEASVFRFGTITTEVFNSNSQLLITMSLDRKNQTQTKGYLELNSGQHFKTINGQTILGSGDIVIEGGTVTGSVDLDLFEVVTELPTENINENKIYLMKDPTTSNKVISVEGMTPTSDYEWDGKDAYIQDGEATIDGTTINNDKRTRVTIKGFEGDFYITLGLSLASMDIIANQLYIQVQSLNEDTSNGKPDNWFYRETAQVGEGVSWTSIGLGTLDPTQEYFVDIWTNGGQASVGGVDFYLPSYIAVPQSEVSESLFIEYIYNNGEWEMLGKSIKMVDEKAYRSIGVDPNGFDGKSYAIFSREDGSGDILEVAKINGKTLLGWEAKEFSLAETKEVTQEEYDALTPEDGVLYVITDAEEVGIPTKVSQLENDSKFISEGNLKTVNGNSLIGEGDIVIEGGSGGSDMTNYYTKEEIDNKGFITAIPDEYITSDELSTQLSDKVSQTAFNEAINEVGDVVEALEGDIAKKADTSMLEWYKVQNIQAYEDSKKTSVYINKANGYGVSDTSLALYFGTINGSLITTVQNGDGSFTIPEFTLQEPLTASTGIQIVDNVISLTEWVGTQEEYDALETKSDSITYYILEE